MNDNNSIKTFEGKSIRTIRDEEQDKLFYSVSDVIGILSESTDPIAYWRKLKQRISKMGIQPVTVCHGLKLQAADGKMRLIDVADNEQLIRLIQHISSPKKESFLHWLGHFNQSEIENRIYTIRSVQVMIDSDLAEMYGVDTKRLNEQVIRNIERFSGNFRFQLTENEWEILNSQFINSISQRSQIATFEENSLNSQNMTFKKSKGKYRKYLPYVFTEQGVAMLSSVLNSDTAVKVSIMIMEAFVGMRKILLNNASLYQRVDKIEIKQHQFEIKQHETDDKIEKIFKALESKNVIPEKGIFYDGQIFDAWKFVSDIVRSAKSEIIIIDNYIDDRVLELLTKRESGVKVTIYTNSISRQLKVDIEKHNSQYEPIIVKEFHLSHDRFLIIDEKQVYHIGASLKDLGKRWFGFTLIKDEGVVNGLLERLGNGLFITSGN